MTRTPLSCEFNDRGCAEDGCSKRYCKLQYEHSKREERIASAEREAIYGVAYDLVENAFAFKGRPNPTPAQVRMHVTKPYVWGMAMRLLAMERALPDLTLDQI